MEPAMTGRVRPGHDPGGPLPDFSNPASAPLKVEHVGDAKVAKPDEVTGILPV